MTEVLLFHHVLGQTQGFHAFADGLRQAGHTVHTPDVFAGRTFPSVDAGAAHVQEKGFEEFLDRAVGAADGLPDRIVYAGFSLGVLPAQKLAQTRPGARGALLLEACVPVGEFGDWPQGVPVQIHGMDNDPFFAGEGDVEAATALVEHVAPAELFVYPGDQHLFADSSLPSYRPEAASLLMDRVLAFLAAVG